MANRYWVGGTGNWSDTAKWSTSDGGGSGASVPTNADDVFFTASSNTGTGAFTVTLNTSTRACRNFTASGLDGVMTLAGSQTLQICGSLSLPATNFTWSQTGGLQFLDTGNVGARTINLNGATASSSAVSFSGASSTFTLAAAFTATNGVAIDECTFALAGYTLTAATFAASNAGVKTMTFGTGGNVTLTGTGTVWNYSGSNLTITDPANANITLTNTTTTARTFAGGGVSYGTLTIGGSTGTSTLTITGSNTFAAIASTKTVAHTIVFADGSAQTIGAWTASGSAGNVLTITGGTTGGHSATINGLAEPLTSVDYCSVTRITSAEINEWYWGNNSVDGGSNTNQYFSSRPTMFIPFFEFEFQA